MQYEEVVLKEKTVVGLKARTQNSDSDMKAIIGGLWKRFFEKGIYEAIEKKKSLATIGLYDAYESDVNGAYDVTVCVEVEQPEKVPEGCVVKQIPGGKYAKFKVKGDMQQAVAQFWMEFYQMDLERSYKADFEEYVGGTPEECEINIYIAI